MYNRLFVENLLKIPTSALWFYECNFIMY